jgi:EthD domain
MIKILVFNKRKDGVSIEEYRNHYETVHVPLAHSLFPSVAAYRRNYVDFESTARADTRAGVSTTGPDFDSVAEVFFASWEAFEAFRDRSANPEVRAQVLADEEKFLDPSAIQRVVVIPDGDSPWS